MDPVGRDELLLSLIAKDSPERKGRAVEPLKDPGEREKLRTALGPDLTDMLLAMTQGDPQKLRQLNDKHFDLINDFWAKSTAGSVGDPPPTDAPPPVAPPDKSPGDFPGAGPGSGYEPASGPGGSPGGFDPGGGSPGRPGGGNPGGGSPGSGPAGGGLGGRGGSNMGKLRGDVSKALGTAKNEAGSFDKKEDNFNATPKPMGPQGQPGRPNQPGAPSFSPGSAPRQIAQVRPGGTAPQAAPAGTRAPSRTAGPASPPGGPARTPSSLAIPGEGPRTTSPPGVGGPPMAPLGNAKLPGEETPPGEEALSPEELAAIKEIQEMLAAASEAEPLDTQALRNGGDKLDGAALGAMLKGIDVNALRNQIEQVLEMARVEGFPLTKQEVVDQAAVNLGLSKDQAGRILRALGISSRRFGEPPFPPFPQVKNLTLWQRLLAWARYYKARLIRRLI